MTHDRNHDSGIRNHDSGIRNHDSGTGTHDSGTWTHDSGTRTHDSGTRAHDSGTGTHDSGTSTHTRGACHRDRCTHHYGPPDQLSAPALAGQNIIQVNNQAEFAVGEVIVIDAGTPIEETRTIVGFSSIILDSTLLFDHTVASPVQRQAVNPVTLSPGNPCALVTTPQPSPANPCASFARLSDGEGTAGKKTQRSAFSVVNIGMLGFCALCVAGIVLGVKKMKRSKETLSYASLPSRVGVPGDMENGARELLAEAPME